MSNMNKDDPISDGMRILGSIIDFFLSHPMSQFSLFSLNSTFPTIDVHRYLVKLENDDVLVRSRITINGKPVTHWNLKGSVSQYLHFGRCLPSRSIQNDYATGYNVNSNYKHSNKYNNITTSQVSSTINNYNDVVEYSQFKGMHPIECFNYENSLKKVSNTNSNIFEEYGSRSPSILYISSVKKETLNESELLLEMKQSKSCTLAPRRLKELSLENMTKLNPDSPVFIPLSTKNPKSLPNLERSNSLEITEVNNLSMELMTALTKNPVSVLYEFAQQRGMSCDIDVVEIAGPSHKPKISMHVNLNGRIFDTIIATNKKEGKRLAADTAIRTLISEGHFAERISRLSTRAFCNDGDIHSGEIMSSKSSIFIMDNMGSLVYNELAKLLKGLTPEEGITLAGRKVVSALIMQDEKHDTFQVVSLATGNRCITGDKISLQGKVVNDCHAEVVVRRAFIVFLYRQLFAQISDSSMSLNLFDKSSNTQNYKLKSHIKFHLYISTAPCGDSALFCNRENDHKKSESDFVLSKDHHPTFEHPVQGLLRSKIEGGEGTIPVNNTRQLSQVQSLDGIFRGERLKTMSCSDKIARWNYLGIQGSLLTQILDPIFLKSIFLGNLYNAGHLCRALCCRLDRNKLHQKNVLENVNHPDLGYIYVGGLQREIDKSNELSINWSYGLKLEVIDGVTGQLVGVSDQSSTYSRISKVKLFGQYMILLKKMGHSNFDYNLTYGQAKLLSIDYDCKKQKLYEIFHKLEYGSWIRKPLEQSDFRNVDF